MIVPDKIETERLILRPHRMDDLDAFVGFLLHPSATRYMAFTAEQKTRNGARQMLEFVIASYATRDPVFSLTIADATTDQYLGSCGASRDGEDIEIYYTVLPEHQGQGIATEATRALVEHLTSVTSARLVACVVPKNVASVRVAQRLGFVDAGPVQRKLSTRELQHERLTGRKYVFDR